MGQRSIEGLPPAGGGGTLQLVSRFDVLRERYDAVLCDIWGVVHNGVHAFPPAVAALQRFRASGGRVVLLSNVPKPRGSIPPQLDRLGVPRDAWDAVVTSGDATRAALAARRPGPVHLIGTAEDAVLWAGLGLAFTDLDRAAFLLVTGLDDFFHGQLGDYAERFARARARDLELVCANPDIVVRHGEALYWCAGALARDYAALGGRVVLSGKPHAPIYALAFETLAPLCGAPVDRARVLVIGDGPATDILGANREGLDALFVAGGILAEAFDPEHDVDPAQAVAALHAEGARARFAMPRLQ